MVELQVHEKLEIMNIASSLARTTPEAFERIYKELVDLILYEPKSPKED